MAGDVILRISVEQLEALREIGILEEELQDVGAAGERAGETAAAGLQAMAASAIAAIGGLQAIRDLWREIVGLQERSREIATEQAQDAQETRQLANALRFGEDEFHVADAIRRALESAGLDESDVRGALDTIQEYLAEAQANPDDELVQQRIARLGELFDLPAIQRGGQEGFDQFLADVADLTADETSLLPALGLPINDFQRLQVLARQFVAAGGTSAIVDSYGNNLITPEIADALFQASGEASVYESNQERLDRVAAGVQQPAHPIEYITRGPYGRRGADLAIAASETADDLPFGLGRFVRYANPILDSLVTVGDLLTGGGQPVTLEVDGQPVSAGLRTIDETGGTASTGGP